MKILASKKNRIESEIDNLRGEIIGEEMNFSELDETMQKHGFYTNLDDGLD